ncbi:MAG: hypothetical protein JRG97_05235 [Deltaproteobacteria bacterium]|nr:hypothetical protein [Deltaproteobacteria bacterium]MBW2050750.1 hypothetical protein [Deltaproteobacteria bacterium]MBW2140461.1 hypothetical protein [Deltaproteobacteria bacterium]MBW2321990.1 hypothetical protein [Deltaproteobacteria bacterium]
MDEFCQKCGRTLKPEELQYGVKIELTSLFHGCLEEVDGDIDQEIERLIEIVSRQDPEEAEKDVAQTIYLVICRSCRNQLVKEWDIKRRVH